MTEVSSRGWRAKEPGDNVEAEKPNLLSRAIDLIVEQGISIDDLANEARIPVDLINAIAPTDIRPKVQLFDAGEELRSGGAGT